MAKAEHETGRSIQVVDRREVNPNELTGVPREAEAMGRLFEIIQALRDASVKEGVADLYQTAIEVLIGLAQGIDLEGTSRLVSEFGLDNTTVYFSADQSLEQKREAFESVLAVLTETVGYLSDTDPSRPFQACLRELIEGIRRLLQNWGSLTASSVDSDEPTEGRSTFGPFPHVIKRVRRAHDLLVEKVPYDADIFDILLKQLRQLPAIKEPMPCNHDEEALLSRLPETVAFQSILSFDERYLVFAPDDKIAQVHQGLKKLFSKLIEEVDALADHPTMQHFQGLLEPIRAITQEAELPSQTESIASYVAFWDTIKHKLEQQFQPEVDIGKMREVTQWIDHCIQPNLAHLSSKELAGYLRRKGTQAALTIAARAKQAVLSLHRIEAADEQVRFQLLPPLAPFLDRGYLLEKLSNGLETHGQTTLTRKKMGQSLSGIGGVGKTALAHHYVQQVRGTTKYEVMLWLHADAGEAGLDRQYLALCEGWLGLTDIKPQEAVAHIHQVLKERDTLVVFDDVSDPEVLTGYLPDWRNNEEPDTARFHVIITSRHQQWDSNFATLPVDVFEAEETQAYVQMRFEGAGQAVVLEKAGETEAVLELHEILGGLPLALSQACAYILEELTQHADYCIADYLAEYREEASRLLLHENDQGDAAIRSVMISVNLSLAKLRAYDAEHPEHPIAGTLLGICSYLGSHDIPVVLLERLLHRIVSVVKGETDKNVYRHLECLSRYGLVTVSGQGADTLVASHNLTQYVVRQWNEIKDLTSTLLEDLSNEMIQTLAYDERDMVAIRRLSPFIFHAYQIAQNSEKYFSIAEEQQKERLLECASLYSAIAYHQSDGTSQLKLAILADEKAYSIRKTICDANDPSVADALKALSYSYYKQGHYELAKNYYLQALSIMKHVKKNNLISCLLSLNDYTNLMNIFIAQGDLDFGEFDHTLEYDIQFIEKHVQNLLYRNTAELDNKDTYIISLLAETFSTRGTLYFEKGDYENSKVYYEKASALYKHFYGEDHVKYASLLVSLGRLYNQWGQYEVAKNKLESALKIEESHYDKENIEFVITLCNLGHTYRNLEEYDSARENYGRALLIAKNTYGKTHMQYGNVLFGLGSLFYSRGELKLAETYISMAIEIFESYYDYDTEHYKCAQAYSERASLYFKQESYKEAKDEFEKVLKIKEKHYGMDSFDLIGTLYNLGQAYRNLEEYDKALTYFKRAYEIDKKSPVTPLSDKIRKNLSLLYEGRVKQLTKEVCDLISVHSEDLEKAEGKISRAEKYWDRLIKIKNHDGRKVYTGSTATGAEIQLTLITIKTSKVLYQGYQFKLIRTSEEEIVVSFINNPIQKIPEGVLLKLFTALNLTLNNKDFIACYLGVDMSKEHFEVQGNDRDWSLSITGRSTFLDLVGEEILRVLVEDITNVKLFSKAFNFFNSNEGDNEALGEHTCTLF